MTGMPARYGEAMQARTIRMTNAQYAKFQQLGGAAWFRETLTKAKPDKRTRELRRLHLRASS